MTLVVDPMLELVHQLDLVEDWLLWFECDTDEQAATIAAGAAAAANLASAIRSAFAAELQLYDPTGAELAPVAGIPSEAVSEAHRAITAAAEAVQYGDDRRPVDALGSLGLVAHCLDQDGTDAVLQLARVLNQTNTAKAGGGRWFVATVREEDDRGAGIDRERVATRLDPEEYQAYRQYLAAVFNDPLTRFAATGT